ncbi:Ubiquitin carboxyl-terminal hydrolase isozyme L3 [Chlorella vulgaris]
MLKAIKKLKKQLGTRPADGSQAPSVGGAGLPPRPQAMAPAGGVTAAVQQQQARSSAAVVAASPQAQPSPRSAPPSARTSPSVSVGDAASSRSRPPSPSCLQYHDEAGRELGVDYELVAGALDLDGGLEHGHGSGGASPSQADAQQQHAAQNTANGGANDSEPHQQQQQVWHGSSPSSRGPSADDEAAGTATQGGSDAAAAATGSAAAAEAAACDGITDALATMMYLTEDADDCVSVVSDALSDEDFPDDISELSRALEALEGEALGSSPASLAGSSSLGGAGSGGLDDQLAERLGISPDAGDPTAFSQQMAKLYNNLGLKMMERRNHEEALGLLRKAEAIVENDAMWRGQEQAQRRQRMRAITFNNLGCLLKRRNQPQLALQYLQKALALEEKDGPVQNSSSTHLNISAAFSALKRPKEALAHAERAIILLQRHLWAPHLPFQDGLSFLVRQLAAPGASHHLLASANVLAMAYHNAAVEHEKLGHLREALVSFTRALLIATKCLGAKAAMTASLSKALKAFQQRQARYLPSGAVHAARKAPSTLASSALQSKRGGGHSRSGSKSVASGKSSSSLAGKSMGSLVAAAANGKATLPLDKASRTGAILAAASTMGKKWVPLEANPDVLNDFAAKLGVSTARFQFTDIWGLDSELLAMVPSPTIAVLLLFPITEATEAARKEEQAAIEATGQDVSASLYYMKQTIGNACGTIALLHAVANNRESLDLADGSFMDQFLEATASLDPAARGAYLEQPPAGAPDIDSIHQAAAQQGATLAPAAEEEVNLHFAAFVAADGALYELDGRKAGPINHGPCREGQLLEATAQVVREKFIERANSIQFSLIALAAAGVD